MFRAYRSNMAGFLLAAFVVLQMLAPAWALDNPDAPDFTATFEQRAKPFEIRISESAGSAAVTAALAQYEKFLDAELNLAYAALSKNLPAEGKKRLLQSQREWLAFRDAEFIFIRANWTREQFGSSADLSRGSYRASIAKSRILTLFAYLKNYPATHDVRNNRP